MNFKLPLSGDVSQTINPWTLWLRYLTQQSGFININNFDSGDPEIEKKIIEEVASYGRQLGWITEILELIIRRLKLKDLKDLTVEDRSTLNQFFDLLKRIEDIKHDLKPPKVSLENIDQVIEEIDSWKEKDEKTYRKIVSRLQKALPNKW